MEEQLGVVAGVGQAEGLGFASGWGRVGLASRSSSCSLWVVCQD